MHGRFTSHSLWDLMLPCSALSNLDLQLETSAWSAVGFHLATADCSGCVMNA